MQAENTQSAGTMVVFSETYNPSKNLRISFFLTVVDCWIKAAEMTQVKIITQNYLCDWETRTGKLNQGKMSQDNNIVEDMSYTSTPCIRTRARDILQAVSLNNQLVLLVGRVDDGHAGSHLHVTNMLLAKEVTDVNDGVVVLASRTIDGEMSVHGPHLVAETLKKNHERKDVTTLKNENTRHFSICKFEEAQKMVTAKGHE